MGCLNPAFSRSIILVSGLAHWFPMDPEANFTILGTRRAMITWVILIYLVGFHMMHYAHEPLQRSMECFTISKTRDLKSDFHRKGRYDAWNLFYTVVGKHLQGQKSHVTINGVRVQNPLYVMDEDGELMWLFGNFLREMCYEEAPFLPTPDECVEICKASCAWQAPQLRKEVMLLGGYKDREFLLPGLSDAGERFVYPPR